MTSALFANLLGLSDSLTVARRGIAITRQGNGNFAIAVHTLFNDGKRGFQQIGENYRSLADAQAFVAEQAGGIYGGCKVVVAPSALAA